MHQCVGKRRISMLGFALSYPATQTIRIIICTTAIMEVAKGMRFVSELNRTIDHEALHAAHY